MIDRAVTLALASALVIAAPASAQADAPLRVLILADDDDDEVVARIEGQVADLPVALARGAALDDAGALASQLATAQARARAQAADAVVWFVRDGDGWIVHVADPAAGRLLVRRVDSGAGAMSASAALESAALMVRTALRGLAAGGEIAQGRVARHPEDQLQGASGQAQHPQQHKQSPHAQGELF